MEKPDNYKTLRDPFIYPDFGDGKTPRSTPKNRILAMGDNNVLYVWNWAVGDWVPYMSWKRAAELGLHDPSEDFVPEVD